VVTTYHPEPISRYVESSLVLTEKLTALAVDHLDGGSDFTIESANYRVVISAS
jgi:hypothetical protein